MIITPLDADQFILLHETVVETLTKHNLCSD